MCYRALEAHTKEGSEGLSTEKEEESRDFSRQNFKEELSGLGEDIEFRAPNHTKNVLNQNPRQRRYSGKLEYCVVVSQEPRFKYTILKSTEL